MSKTRLLATIPLALAFTLFSAGCGEKNPNAPGRVSGTVTYKGAPLKGGTVRFHTAEGGELTAQISKEGTYSLSDVPLGELAVTVETESAKPKKTEAYGGGRAIGQQQPPGGAPPPPDPSEYVQIPKKYNDKNISGLRPTIKKGDNTFNITMD